VASMDGFNPQAISNTMWAYAKFSVRPSTELLGRVERRAVASMDGFNPQDLANMIWTYATLGVLPSTDLLASMASQTLVHLDQAAFGVLQLQQLHIFLVFLRLESPSSPAVAASFATVEGRLGDVGRAAMADSPVSESNLQHQVVALVRKLGFECEEEAKDPVSGYSIDALIKPSGSNGWEGGSSLGIAIEVDGPYHYLSNSEMPNGSTLLKRRLLDKLGYRVVSVPHWEWYHQNQVYRVAFLSKLLCGVSSREPPAGGAQIDPVTKDANQALRSCSYVNVSLKRKLCETDALLTCTTTASVGSLVAVAPRTAFPGGSQGKRPRPGASRSLSTGGDGGGSRSSSFGHDRERPFEPERKRSWERPFEPEIDDRKRSWERPF